MMKKPVYDMQKKETGSHGTLYVGITGMYCEHCYDTVKSVLMSLDGVDRVTFRMNTAKISGSTLPDHDTIISAVRNAGYETDADHISTHQRRTARGAAWLELLIFSAILISAGYIINRVFGYNIFNAIPAIDSSMSYRMLFLTGLLTGVHCMGMCGAIGLYASVDRQSERSMKRPLLYNSGRILSYTAIGGVVGMVGSAFSLSNRMRAIIILISGAVMLVMSLSMLGLFPFRLPRFFRFSRRKGKAGAFAVGLLNGFMPCGPLQAMQIYALSTGSFLSGAFSMFIFALGTVPLMFGSGLLINLTKGRAKRIIGKAAAALIFVLSISMIGRGLSAFGLDPGRPAALEAGSFLTATLDHGIQTVYFELDYDSYADIIVQKNIPVRMTIHADEKKITGCNNEVVSSDFGFDAVIKPGETVIEFLPEKEGDYVYTCWMNMVRNHIKVVDGLSE